MDLDFEDYVAARWVRLVRFACLLGCTLPEAEDVVQSALLKCLPRWSTVRAAHDVEAYVHRAVINTFRTARGRRWSGEIATADPVASADPADTAVRNHTVARALATLSPEQRDVVVLRYYAHLGEQQTADVLGVPAGTVKSRLSRALKTLAADRDLLDLGGVR